MYANQVHEQLSQSIANLQKMVRDQSQDIADLRHRVRQLELENSERERKQ